MEFDGGKIGADDHLAGWARVGGDDKRAVRLAPAPVQRDVEPFLARLQDMEFFHLIRTASCLPQRAA